MHAPRNLLEWMFDIMAAVGLVVAFASILLRGSYPSFDFVTVVVPTIGFGLFLGGILGAQHCRQKRLDQLVNDPAHGEEDAN